MKKLNSSRWSVDKQSRNSTTFQLHPTRCRRRTPATACRHSWTSSILRCQQLCPTLNLHHTVSTITTTTTTMGNVQIRITFTTHGQLNSFHQHPLLQSVLPCTIVQVIPEFHDSVLQTTTSATSVFIPFSTFQTAFKSTAHPAGQSTMAKNLSTQALKRRAARGQQRLNFSIAIRKWTAQDD
ncbi:hypothetical protein Tsp_13942 [Trichinella spiralis]|uniref:hypothetical protein n=1 Tax=Trichinella spiralis TaxID=6334 RepID=UPI0001EFDEB3|nr:hypothetical protein Tsp_13942 [Trichinella spiralis]